MNNNFDATIPASEPRWTMPLVDVVLAFVAFGLAYYVRYDLQLLRPVFEANVAAFDPYLPYVAFYALLLLVNNRGRGLYKNIRGRSWAEEVYAITNGATNATVMVMAVSFFLQPAVFSRLMLLYAAAITVILLSLARAGQRIIRANLRNKGIGVQRVLIIGVGETGQAVLRTMIARKELGYKPVGYLDDNPDRGNVDLGRVKGLGKTDNLQQVIRDHEVNLVVITLRWKHHDRIVELVRASQRAGAEVRVVPDVFQLNMRQVQVENLDGIPLLGMSGVRPFYRSNRLLKRSMDWLLIVIASPILLPLLALVALAIRLEGPGPILYSQRRVGENGREFNMIKFRSMIPDAEKYRKALVETHELDPRHPKIPDDPRITRVGKIIRKFSIDELPNILNVLRGEMSLVGPRPPTPDEVQLYDAWHRQRLKIMPGITGLWQVSGRSDVPFDEMCLLDIYYIENWSIQLDLQILMMTLPRVLMRQGAY
jgi:exopolysaccharide biosynthesis polyprenyl glycosylphosphotransferase